MDRRSELRDFLVSRRARVTPGQAGLVVGSGVRRVPGLRRDEVARLAGVGVDYLEQLNDLLAGAETVLDDDVFDRIDEIVPPGSDVGRLEMSYHPPATVTPALRRRRPDDRAAAWGSGSSP